MIKALLISLLFQAAPLNMQEQLHVLQKQVDTLQTRTDTTQHSAAHLDVLRLDYLETVYVEAWAFACGGNYKLVVEVDGIQSVQAETLGITFPRVNRSDVVTVYSTFCPTGSVPSNSGFTTLVDMRGFEPGINSDNIHSFRIRIYDANKNLTFSDNTKSISTVTGIVY